MLYCSVLSEVHVPPYHLRLQATLLTALGQNLGVFFPLAPAYDLSNLGHQYVHGCHCPLVVVQLHVEGLDVFGVIPHYGRLLVHLLRDVALVLRPHVNAPHWLFLESDLAGLHLLLQQVDGLRVRDAHKVVVQHVLEPVPEPLLPPREVLEEVQVLLAVLQRIGHQELQVVLRQVHVVEDVPKRELGLDHPEFGQMTAGVAVLCPEGGAERVHVPQSTGVGLHVELARHGEGRAAGKEVLGVINVPVLLAGERLRVGLVLDEGGDAELLPGPLAVRRRDQGRVDVQETALVEELVRGEGHGVAHAHDGGVDLGSGAQVGDVAQVLQGVELLGERVELAPHCSIVPPVHRAQHLHTTGLQLHLLALRRGLHQRPGDGEGCPGAPAGLGLGEPSGVGQAGDDLHAAQAGPVVHLQEHQLAPVRLPARAHPALHRELVAHLRLAVLEHLADAGAGPAELGLEGAVGRGRAHHHFREGAGRSGRQRGRPVAQPLQGAHDLSEGGLVQAGGAPPHHLHQRLLVLRGEEA
mmetsp:Transcript_12279/g.18093  ORF Transcript_12279/g.18093 Transcript_12279/m.18093 type:complete len:524 (+) Transcript_12279:289-1860(+)